MRRWEKTFAYRRMDRKREGNGNRVNGFSSKREKLAKNISMSLVSIHRNASIFYSL